MKLCAKCQKLPRLSNYAYCVGCRTEYNAQYHLKTYANRRDGILARVRQHTEEERNKIRARARKRVSRPEIKAARKEYIHQYNIETRIAHVQAVNRWRKKNPERFRITAANYRNNHRARKKNAPGIFRYIEWLEKCEFHGWKCFYCAATLNKKTVTMDHRKPISKGGSNWLANLVPACKSCNSRKQANLEFKAAA